MFGERLVAPADERTFVRRAAVLARLDVGELPVERAAHPGEVPRDLGLERLDGVGDVLADEQVMEVGEGAGAVQVHHLRAADRHSGGARRIELERHVGDELLLHAERGLHLDEPPAAPALLEYVERREGAAGREARLEDDLRAAVHGLPRGLDALLHLPRLEIHEDAAVEALAGELPNPVAAVEDDLEPRVGLQFRRVRLVHLPPESAEALEAGAEARL